MRKKITAPRNRTTKRWGKKAEHYLYTVGWSEDDDAYVARVAEFPSLAAHGDSQEAALCSIQKVVRAVLKDMARSKEPPPIESRPIG